MKNRRLVYASLLVVLALVAVACGDDDATTTIATTTTAAPATTAATTTLPPEPEVTFDVGVTAAPCADAVNEGNGCIYLGVISDLTTGPFAPLGVPLTQAQEDFWATVNAAGGIDGWDVVITAENTIDAHYDGAETAAGAVALSDRVLGLAQSLGTPQTSFVTLGLVFIGEHLFREATPLTGGVGVGRATAVPKLFGFRLDQDGEVLGLFLSKEQRLFFLGLALLLVLGFVARNLARSRVGRALAAIRDRDIAAEMMGISLGRYKLIAFVVSSFYAGVAGALLYSAIGRLEPGAFNLLLSIEFIAMILIGGVATVSGSIMGAVFISFLPELVRWLSGLEFFGVKLFGFISPSPSGGFVNLAQMEEILFGVLIVGFLILEPLGLYGIWIRVRNYWKAWPFSY